MQWPLHDFNVPLVIRWSVHLQSCELHHRLECKRPSLRIAVLHLQQVVPVEILPYFHRFLFINSCELEKEKQSSAKLRVSNSSTSLVGRAQTLIQPFQTSNISKLIWYCSLLILKWSRNAHKMVPKLLWNCPGIAYKTALKLTWKRSDITRKFHLKML